ncbi:DNA-3-methyladenine glycosylase I [Radiobacillus kanasensis]|uniref:DNA-3-methyladenine glycosylase I n=1 Tax=Radiobacillus kanasensis TaxID=2844358 RepID=UPI001E539E4A|nr:DNA-3-methyladenine glycosylase I [Radiobacillus kanasensis]UFU00801.1 DNA-3-methyladenine glycosylase I [Radiobacillus kanasensis]
MKRCWDVKETLYQDYHDHEWGVPVYDDQTLFEMLILEGAQAGLNWFTILQKRENYRKAFDQFDATKIAKYDEKKVEELLSNSGIIRNKLKIRSTITNAKLFLDIQKEFGSFKDYIWQFVGGEPIINHRKNLSEVPVTTKESDRMSKDLKKRGFKFVGSTICYSYMQAVGMIDDHLVDCDIRKQRLS